MPLPTTTWNPNRLATPTQGTNNPLDQIRYNLYAMVAQTALGVSLGWNWTNSVTRSEASPGTTALPARKYWYRGSGNTKQWVKAVCSYTGTNLTKFALYYSDNNEYTYVPMLADDGTYVMTLTYSGSDLTSATWGSTP
jgi:hypothetical protein